MTITTAQLDGWFKRVYGDALERAVPDFAVLRKLIPFKKQNKIGDTYNVPVKLSRSHGQTWAGGNNAGTAFTLNNPISMVTKQAQLTGSEFVLREQISYGAISRSGSGNDESFGPVLDEVPLEMAEAANFYLEMALLYGGTSIGTLNANISGGGGTTPSCVISLATWAAGLWAQMTNAAVDVYDTTLVTKRNTNTVTVTSVAPDTRTITFSTTAGDLNAAVATDVIVPAGSNGNWFSGIDKIVTNAGTLFGISAATYSLWKSNTYSASSAPLTMSKVQAAVSAAVVNGGLMEEVTVLLSTYSWTDLNNDLAALRRFADSTKNDLDIGTQNITFYGPNGKMVLLPHPMVKAGEAFCLPLKYFRRVGSSDVTFQLPDMPQGQFFRHLTDSAGIELRNYFDQAILCVRPARASKITTIANSSLT